MKLKHLYMLGVVALMTASCNEDRFLDLKPQARLVSSDDVGYPLFDGGKS